MGSRSTVVKQRIKMMTLLLFVNLAATASALAQDGNGVKRGLTAGRLESILISLLGIASLIFSIRHFRSSKNVMPANKRRSILITGLAAFVCIILAGVHIANSNGGFGTGSGKAGAIVAIILGLIAIVLTSVSLSRFRRAA